MTGGTGQGPRHQGRMDASPAAWHRGRRRTAGSGVNDRALLAWCGPSGAENTFRRRCALSVRCGRTTRHGPSPGPGNEHMASQPISARGKRGGTIGRRACPINAACWHGINHRATPPAPVLVLLRDQGPSDQGRSRNSRGSVASDQVFRRDRVAVRSRSASGPDNPASGPLQTWFRFRHLRERRSARHRKDRDTVMVLPVPVHASRIRNCRYAKDADITSPWRTGLQVDARDIPERRNHTSLF